MRHDFIEPLKSHHLTICNQCREEAGLPLASTEKVEAALEYQKGRVDFDGRYTFDGLPGMIGPIGHAGPRSNCRSNWEPRSRRRANGI